MRRFAVACAVALICAGGPALAQQAAIPIHFRPLAEAQYQALNQAILAAFAQPPFQLQDVPTRQTLIVSIPDGVHATHAKDDRTVYSFTVHFLRDGDPLGTSDQLCDRTKLEDCSGQMVQDAVSAAAPR